MRRSLMNDILIRLRQDLEAGQLRSLFPDLADDIEGAITEIEQLRKNNHQLQDTIKEMEYEIERLEELSQETYQELSQLEREATDE